MVKQHSTFNEFIEEWGGAIFWVCAILFFIIAANWNGINNFLSPGRITCKDVTSYDYNWDNDMLCTRSNGSTFYTDYAGARQYQ